MGSILRVHVGAKMGILTDHKECLYRSNAGMCYTQNGDGCGQVFSRRLLTVDHVIPRAYGGTTDYNNKQLLCYKCHTRKNTWYNIALGADRFTRNTKKNILKQIEESNFYIKSRVTRKSYGEIKPVNVESLISEFLGRI